MQLSRSKELIFQRQVRWIFLRCASSSNSSEPGPICMVLVILAAFNANHHAGLNAALGRVEVHAMVAVVILASQPGYEDVGPCHAGLRLLHRDIFVKSRSLFRNVVFLVLALGVDLPQVLQSLLLKHVLDVLHIPVFSSHHYLLRNLWIFGENLIPEESLCQGNGLNNGFSKIDELRFLVKADIVATYLRILLAFYSNLYLCMGESLTHHVVTDSHHSVLDEVHVRYFILFVKN